MNDPRAFLAQITMKFVVYVLTKVPTGTPALSAAQDRANLAEQERDLVLDQLQEREADLRLLLSLLPGCEGCGAAPASLYRGHMHPNVSGYCEDCARTMPPSIPGQPDEWKLLHGAKDIQRLWDRYRPLPSIFRDNHDNDNRTP